LNSRASDAVLSEQVRIVRWSPLFVLAPSASRCPRPSSPSQSVTTPWPRPVWPSGYRNRAEARASGRRP